MSELKKPLGFDVLTAARQRVAWVFDKFPRVYLSFSAGKDSSVLLHLVADEARRRNTRFGLLLIDLEAQYKATIEHAEAMFVEYADCIEPYWIALPLSLRNAVSNFEPKWQCWDPAERDRWVRTPPAVAITDPKTLPFFRPGMEFEEFTLDFARWYSQGKPTASLVGIRCDESLNRFRAIMAGAKQHDTDKQWVTWQTDAVYNAYPIYDWQTRDIWIYHGKTNKPYNYIYDLMHKAGISIHQARICQPYGDDQRKGLWLYHLLEPETWAKVVARVHGANSGALYARESGNINGTIKVKKPDGITWKQFADSLLESMPQSTAEHYRNKIAVFLRWYSFRGYQAGIPDEADAKAESSRDMPSWRRICKALLRNDYWCKGLSFTQQKSDSYERYMKLMKTRRQQWNMN